MAENGQLWMATALIDGPDADAALRAGAMTPARAVHIVTEAAAALDFAHAHRVVHRDVKPANILLSGGGDPEQVWVGDFGIARAVDEAGLRTGSAMTSTLLYTAPEALSGPDVDGRADIYSLGCTLFRLLTGRPPFVGGSGPAAIMVAHLQTPPPRVTDLVAALPAALDDVIATALAKDPAARFGSARALAEATAAALHGRQLAAVPSAQVSPEPSAPPPHTPAHPEVVVTYGTPDLIAAPAMAPPRRRRGALIGGLTAAAVVVAAGIVAVVAWPRGDAAGPSTPASHPTANQGPPATDAPASALPSILLAASEIPNNTGDDAVVLERDGTALLTESATVDDPSCLGAWAPAQTASYARPTPAGAAVQELRALYKKPWQASVTQAVVAFSSVEDAGLSLQLQRMQWDRCAGATVTVTPAGEPAQTWTFGRPANKAGSYTVAAVSAGEDATCQHGIEIQGNVVIDIRQCGPAAAVDVAALVNATAHKVPRQ